MAGAHMAAVTAASGSSTVADAYRRVRGDTEALCAPLETEDYGVQTMPDVSPVKWHIAHVSWFFETFVLLRHRCGYRAHDPAFDHLFNSYYLTHGNPFLRPQRGFLTRPTVAEVFAYRRAADEAMLALIESADPELWRHIEPLIVLGLHHEQQHQELILTDLKHVFAHNPLCPAYRDDLEPVPRHAAPPMDWWTLPAGLYEIGADNSGFAYDNERPGHRVWLEDAAVGTRPVTNAEYLAFIDAGGYHEPRWWLSDGWATVQAEGWQAPLYWEARDGEWWQLTLGGMRAVDPHAPVCHVSYYEADAFASWAGGRLPTEAEWEICALATQAQADVDTANLRDAGGGGGDAPASR